MKGEIERKLKWFEARAVVDNMINIETHRVAVHQQIMWSDVDKGAHPNLIEGICRRIVLRKPNAVESSWVVGERHLEWRPLPLSTRISGPLSKHLPVTTSRHFLFLLPLHYNQPHLGTCEQKNTWFELQKSAFIKRTILPLFGRPLMFLKFGQNRQEWNAL